MSMLERDLNAYTDEVSRAREKGDLAREADYLQKLGFTYKSLEKYLEARQHFVMAQDILRRIGRGEMAVTLDNQIAIIDEITGAKKITPLQMLLLIISISIALFMAISLVFLGLDFFTQNIILAMIGLAISLLFGIGAIYIGKKK